MSPVTPSLSSSSFAFKAALFGTLVAAYPGMLCAAGLDRNGVGAQSAGVAGASVANTDDAVSSMALNPSALGFADAMDLYLSGTGVSGSGKFEDQFGTRAKMSEQWRFLPDLVFRAPVAKDVTLGFSVIPDSSRIADWDFVDPPGGAGGKTSYGFQRHDSEIENVRAALGVGWRISDEFSVGASIGGVYDRNELDVPYIFQSHPVLAGMKTLLEMETDGLGVNGDIGITWKPIKMLSFGLSYRTPTRFDTSGSAVGDIGAQLRSLGLAGVPSKFYYDADIVTKLPQKISFGPSWQATDRLRLSAQVDWINWSQAFDTLNVHLSNGSNPAINSLLASNGINDSIALKWRDQFVYRAGVEYSLTPQWVLRAGYAHGNTPVPDSTLLPMTAAITEDTLAAGIGYVGTSFRIDLSYQRDLNASQFASGSDITGTEYKNSSVTVGANWLALTLGFKF